MHLYGGDKILSLENYCKSEKLRELPQGRDSLCYIPSAQDTGDAPQNRQLTGCVGITY